MQAQISSGNLVEQLKLMQQRQIEKTKPAEIMRGKVAAVSPLKITIENGQRDLPESYFVLLHTVLDYKVDITVSHETEDAEGGSGQAQYEKHHHGYKGRKTIIVHNGLNVGEEVYLLRQHGGQSFIILDRVHDPIVSGQWE